MNKHAMSESAYNEDGTKKAEAWGEDGKVRPGYRIPQFVPGEKIPEDAPKDASADWGGAIVGAEDTEDECEAGNKHTWQEREAFYEAEVRPVIEGLMPKFKEMGMSFVLISDFEKMRTATMFGSRHEHNMAVSVRLAGVIGRFTGDVDGMFMDMFSILRDENVKSTVMELAQNAIKKKAATVLKKLLGAMLAGIDDEDGGVSAMRKTNQEEERNSGLSLMDALKESLSPEMMESMPESLKEALMGRGPDEGVTDQDPAWPERMPLPMRRHLMRQGVKPHQVLETSDGFAIGVGATPEELKAYAEKNFGGLGMKPDVAQHFPGGVLGLTSELPEAHRSEPRGMEAILGAMEAGRKAVPPADADPDAEPESGS